MDWHSSGAELNRLVEDGFKAHSKDVLAVLEGVLTAGVLGDRPNRLSKAIGIYWGEHRILLAGDVECGNSPLSGWSGILKELEPWGSEPDRRELLQNLSLIKLAHHGSSGAFYEEAWKLHCNGKLVEDAVLTPFNRGDIGAGSNPPQREVLVKLSTKTRRVAATSPEGQAQARLIAAGWKRASAVRAAGTASVAALILGKNERQWVMAGKAEIFMQSL
jgi:hypothetical protein